MAAFCAIVFILAFGILLSEAAPPFLSQPLTANLYEDASDDTQVVCVQCSHPQAFTVDIVNVTVVEGTDTNRCTGCFTIRRLHAFSDFCLRYTKLSESDKVEYSGARRYLIGVVCSDYVESSWGFVDIRIQPNVPPIFTGPISAAIGPMNAQAIGASQPLHRVTDVFDQNSDTIYFSMATDPVTDVFDIDASTGEIFTLKPLYYFCGSNVIFYVTISDNKTIPNPPKVITCSITNHFIPPSVSNANRDHYVDEDTPVNNGIYTFLHSPISPPVVYTIADVQPFTASGLFSITGNVLVAAAKMDYEDAMTRDSVVTIAVDNGYCLPQQYNLDIHVRNKNDAPVVHPSNVLHNAVEGNVINFFMNVAVTDQDSFAFSYSIISGNSNGLWSVTPGQDIISSTVYDREVHGPNHTLIVQVSDGNANAFITVNIIVSDVNDNPPIFTQAAYAFSVGDCSPPNFFLGYLAATDADSSENFNNLIAFEEITTGVIGVNSQGAITLLQSPTAGTSPSVQVSALDLGTPSLTSPWKVLISITVQNCSIANPTVTPPPCNIATTTATMNASLWLISVVGIIMSWKC